jgi:hypothetical protein
VPRSSNNLCAFLGPFGTADWERRLAPFDAPWRSWEQQEEEAVVMFTPQGKVGWNGWSTPSPSNQRAGGGAPPASAPLAKAKGTSQRAAELEEEVRPNLLPLLFS